MRAGTRKLQERLWWEVLEGLSKRLGAEAALARGLLACEIPAARLARWMRQPAFVEKFRSLRRLCRVMDKSIGTPPADDLPDPLGAERNDPHEAARQERIRQQRRQITSTQPRDGRGRFGPRTVEPSTPQPG